MSGIGFNYIPGSGLVAPIFTFEVNSGGQYQQFDRFILVGHPTSAGTMTVNRPYPVSNQQDVDTLAGPGSHLREMFRVAIQNAPAAPYWIMAISDSALTAAVNTITVGTSALASGVGTMQINGETIQIAVGPTDTVTTIATALAAAINGYYNPLTNAMLPITATSSAGVVTVTARNKGVIGNELDVWIDSTIRGNVFAIASAITVAQTTPGAGTPTTVAGALAALNDDPADFVICPFSDSTSLGSYTAWGNDNSGRWAWSRQSYGHVWTAAVANFSSLTTMGLSLNDRHTSVLGCYAPGANGSPHPSYLWVSAIAALLSPWLSDTTLGNVSRNQTGLVVQGISPPRDPTSRPNYLARNTLLSSGISTWSVNAANQVTVDKVITTYRTGISGNPDTVFRDVQAMYQTAGGLKFLRAGLAVAHGQKALANTNPGNLAAISTPADIKASFINLYTQLTKQGVFQDAGTFASLLAVAINAQNPNRVDCFVPLERVNPLDILAANATVYQQFPAANL